MVVREGFNQRSLRQTGFVPPFKKKTLKNSTKKRHLSTSLVYKAKIPTVTFVTYFDSSHRLNVKTNEVLLKKFYGLRISVTLSVDQILYRNLRKSNKTIKNMSKPFFKQSL